MSLTDNICLCCLRVAQLPATMPLFIGVLMKSLVKVGVLTVAPLILALVAERPGLAAFPVSVDVNGDTWILETITGKGNDIPGLGTTALSPWWGDKPLATQFVQAAYRAGGGTVQGGGQNRTGPYFAWETTASPAGFGYVTYKSDGTLDSGSVGGSANNNVFATATRVNTSSVPGPLPILGATAAFGISRRLRRRISLSAVGDSRS